MDVSLFMLWNMPETRERRLLGDSSLYGFSSSIICCSSSDELSILSSLTGVCFFGRLMRIDSDLCRGFNSKSWKCE